ncbi:MAG: hypothetical protein P8O90_08680 [Flavobacteriaceae bacterium]|nr:hypothetical protein [Flavobacteriaceae bacterium]
MPNRKIIANLQASSLTQDRYLHPTHSINRILTAIIFQDNALTRNLVCAGPK